MSENFGYIDIILLAMLAGFIFLRLRNVLGKGADNSPIKTDFSNKAEENFSFVKDVKEKSKELTFDHTQNRCASCKKDIENLDKK